MASHTAFVELRRVFVENAQGPTGLWQKVSGRGVPTQSILRDVSLHVVQGSQATIFGREGAGKSTLLRVLVGALTPSAGLVRINGQLPSSIKDLAAGYVAVDETEPAKDSVHDILHTFGQTHDISNLPAKLGEIAEILELGSYVHRSATTLSLSQRVRVNLARAALSDSPLVLLDDVADVLGVSVLKNLLQTLFSGRTTLITTRQVAIAEQLELPIYILHQAHLAYSGTCDELANTLACQRVLDVWVEGLRYDLLRTLRQHKGIVEVRLLPSSRFAGQKLRITLVSARYLPSVYDVISQAPLVRVQEHPVSLHDILARL